MDTYTETNKIYVGGKFHNVTKVWNIEQERESKFEKGMVYIVAHDANQTNFTNGAHTMGKLVNPSDIERG